MKLYKVPCAAVINAHTLDFRLLMKRCANCVPFPSNTLTFWGIMCLLLNRMPGGSRVKQELYPGKVVSWLTFSRVAYDCALKCFYLAVDVGCPTNFNPKMLRVSLLSFPSNAHQVPHLIVDLLQLHGIPSCCLKSTDASLLLAQGLENKMIWYQM